MFHIQKTLLAIVVLLAANLALAEANIEFDGGYIQTQNGKYIEMVGKQIFATEIIENRRKIPANHGSSKSYRHWYVADKKGIISILGDDFKGIAIKGRHKFERFSLHPLIERTLKSSEEFAVNLGPATEGRPFYLIGEDVKVRSKSLGLDSYYYQPRNELPKGEYAAWLGKTFWLFEIK